MKQSFTLNQCVRLIYNETSAEESYMLREIIEQNANLKSEFNMMQQAYRALCDDLLTPAKRSVESILQYNQNSPIQVSL